MDASTTNGPTLTPLACRNNLIQNKNSAERNPSIIGATQKRWDRPCKAISGFSIIYSILLASHVVPFSAHFDLFWR
jgi:hypothetical protein